MSDRGDEEEGAAWSAAKFHDYEEELYDVLVSSDDSEPGSSSKTQQEQTLEALNLPKWPSHGELSETHYEELASALKSNPELKELDLRRNTLKESGLELLCAALESPLCRLETLRLRGSVLSERSCSSLVSALKSDPSYLRELDLSDIKNLTDSGVKLLATGLRSPHCRLKTLRLTDCKLSESSCATLLSALQSNPSYLKELDLSGNSVKDSGVELLSAVLNNPLCTLNTLRLCSCDLSENSCDSLASALKSRPFHLHELDLSHNQLKDIGIMFLYNGLKSPHCKLETLRLKSCLLSDSGCFILVSALRSQLPNLMEVDLSGNELQDRGKEALLELVNSPGCRMKSLRVEEGQNLVKPRRAELSGVLAKRRKAAKRELQLPGPSVTRTTDRYSGNAARFQYQGGPASHQSTRRGRRRTLTETPAATTAPIASDSLDDSHLATEDQAYRLFSPELFNEHGRMSYRFRSRSAGVFRCRLTGLMFTMTRDGELSYWITQWNENLLSSTGKSPAGPLFSINCPERAVSQLHLPHCANLPGLSVVHVSDDGMNILQPLEITASHVVVDVPHFSAFGLVWDFIKSLLNFQIPICGQVLLFHRPSYKNQSQKLNVFLLPENVPLQEVKHQQEKAVHIEAPSSCCLTRGQFYSLHCPEAVRIQPGRAPFDLKYGPNYHPTFEIRMTPITEEVTVTVRDKEEKDFWEYHVELTGVKPASAFSGLSVQPPASEPGWFPVTSDGRGVMSFSAPGPSSQITHTMTSDSGSLLSVQAADGGFYPSSQSGSLSEQEDKKLKSVRGQFITRVSNSVLNDLLDVLLQNNVINISELEEMQAKPRADKARELVDTVLRKGPEACKIMTDAFCQIDPFLCETLKLK